MESDGNNKENPPLCASGCGFFGKRGTPDRCSKCYRELCLREAATEANTTGTKSSTVSDLESKFSKLAVTPSEEIKLMTYSDESGAVKDRCVGCNQKLRLAAQFNCRCGGVYCPSHRYPEKHGCNFDYKAAGRVALEKANPVVKSDKHCQRI